MAHEWKSVMRVLKNAGSIYSFSSPNFQFYNDKCDLWRASIIGQFSQRLFFGYNTHFLRMFPFFPIYSSSVKCPSGLYFDFFMHYDFVFCFLLFYSNSLSLLYSELINVVITLFWIAYERVIISVVFNYEEL